jgi:hypothetical protein
MQDRTIKLWNPHKGILIKTYTGAAPKLSDPTPHVSPHAEREGEGRGERGGGESERERERERERESERERQKETYVPH